MKKYIKLMLVIILSLCICMTASVTYADESKFIKIEGGLGLKTDGTLWKLPVETDRMISAVEFRYDENGIEFRYPDSYDDENKKLRQLFRHGENIIDFSAYSIPVSEKSKDFRLKGLVTKNADGIWHGYSSNYFNITRLNLIDVKTQTAGCYANTYTNSKGDSYIYGGPVYQWIPTPIKIDKLENAVSISMGMREGFAVDYDGNIYYVGTTVNDTCEAMLLTKENRHILPDEKSIHIKYNNNLSAAVLTDKNHVYKMSTGDMATIYEFKKVDLEDVIDYEIALLPDYKWYETHNVASGVSLGGYPHLVLLRSDGTVWQTEAVETYPYDDVEYQTTRLKTTLPVQIKGISDVVDIDVLADDILMLKSDGSIIKWGTTSYKDMHTDNPERIETRNFNIALEIGKETMYINGSDVEIDPGRGTKSIEQNGRTYIPIRALIENLGGSIEWSEAEQKVSMSLWGDELEMTIGTNKYYINGEEKQMDVSPILENSRTMVPVRFVGEAFGFTVDYDDKPLTAKLFYREILE